MASRYLELSTPVAPVSSPGCPVPIAACSLLKDTADGTLLVRIRMKNLADQPLTACKVAVAAFGAGDGGTEGGAAYPYPDLSVNSGETFGEETLIPLPTPSARRVEIRVTEAALADGTLWRDAEGVQQEKALLMDERYAAARALMDMHTPAGYLTAVKAFEAIAGWRDAQEQIALCRQELAALAAREEDVRREAEEAKAAGRTAQKRRKKRIALMLAVCAALAILLIFLVIPRLHTDAGEAAAALAAVSM